MTIVLLYAVLIYLVAGIIYYASKTWHYSHIKHTISELGEDNAPYSRTVNMRLFLPVGVMLILIGLLNTANFVLSGLALCLGAGYFISALFPCDPGSPLHGSSKQTIHNIGGFIEYGGGIYFLYKARENLFTSHWMKSELFIGLLIICVIFTSLPGFKLRGLFQRILEFALFGQLLWLSYP